VRIRQWDVVNAPDQEIAAWLRAMNAVLDTELGDEPPWRADLLRDYLGVAMPGEERIAWIAEEAGEIVGYLGAVLLGYDATGTACVELFTHPGHRRQGIAEELLATAARYAAERGQDIITTEVVDGTAAVDFYAGAGFTRTVTEDSSVLDLSTVDWDRMASLANQTAAGYHIENYPGGPPEEMLASYADAKLVVRHTPVADVEWHAGFEADRLRDSLRTLRARGLRPYVAVAVHTASGEVAGLTELVVPAHRPQRADQYDTIVAPAHRGYGLGLAMKARMLLDLRAAEPQVTSVQTWQSEHDEPMLRVNAVLGFEHAHRWLEYEASVAAVAAGRRTA
jgi:GNAT superfamily N-acetyltransferase